MARLPLMVKLPPATIKAPLMLAALLLLAQPMVSVLPVRLSKPPEFRFNEPAEAAAALTVIVAPETIIAGVHPEGETPPTQEPPVSHAPPVTVETIGTSAELWPM